MTPTPTEELNLMQAGLGKRTLNMSEDMSHLEINSMMKKEFPKMEGLCGGWLLHKAMGGSGKKRRLMVVPPDAEGYTSDGLRRATGNGKITLYIVPLQETLDLTPLPLDCQEFLRMPRAKCQKCNQLMPLQILALHIGECNPSDEENLSDSVSDVDITPIENICADPSVSRCPLCLDDYPVDILEIHASSCGESPMFALNKEQQNTSTSSVPPSVAVEEWKMVTDKRRAAASFRKAMLRAHEDESILRLSMDLREDQEEQERSLISFYKEQNVKWASPLKCILEGDPAVGGGVKHFFISTVMNKLQHGFKINMGNMCVTKLFEGEDDHLIPSNAPFYLESDLFLMAGRMVGHLFLLGGPCLTGLSTAVLHVVLGRSHETATISVKDCPDLDIRHTIELLDGNQLTEEHKTEILNLAMSWDLPGVTVENRRWLFEKLLLHSVLGRTNKQMKQFRKGLQETNVLQLLEHRPDVVPLLFPRQSESQITPEQMTIVRMSVILR